MQNHTAPPLTWTARGPERRLKQGRGTSREEVVMFPALTGSISEQLPSPGGLGGTNQDVPLRPQRVLLSYCQVSKIGRDLSQKEVLQTRRNRTSPSSVVILIREERTTLLGNETAGGETNRWDALGARRILVEEEFPRPRETVETRPRTTPEGETALEFPPLAPQSSPLT